MTRRKLPGRFLLFLICANFLLALFLFDTKAAAQTPPAIGTQHPLVVTHNSHVVVMEYENWFGPHAITFQGTAAQPRLQSPDMQSVGGGYDSSDPIVIRQHVAWLESLGIDAALIEITNNVACIFDSEAFVQTHIRNCTPPFRRQNQSIRDNTGNAYPSWSKLGTPLKLIPLLGGIDDNVLTKDFDGKTALEKEIEYFGRRISAYPNLNVIYKGKPLMLIFLGAAQDPDRADNPLWFRIENFLNSHPEFGEKYTFKLMAGYLDSQPSLWTDPAPPTGPVEIAPRYGFWSWVDRLNPDCTGSVCPYFPSYNRAGDRVENLTVSIATAGQNGWGCPNENSKPYCPDDALRFGIDPSTGVRSYATLEAFMEYARELDPIFLFIHQFNEFGQPDEGFDANTDDDIEPANLWGNSALTAVKKQIADYRSATANSDTE